MELERATRRIMWLRNMMTAMQTFWTTHLSTGDLNYGRENRLRNRTPTFLNRLTCRLLLWVTVFEGNDYGGKWATLDEYGSSTIQVIAADVSAHGQNGPDPDTVWLVRGCDGEFSMDKSVTVLDDISVAAIVQDATVFIGDNITSLKWAFVDAVTPGNAHTRVAYHWLKDTLRDGYIGLRDVASPLNLAHFLTEVVMGPAMRSPSYAASGYTSPPAIPPALKFLT